MRKGRANKTTAFSDRYKQRETMCAVTFIFHANRAPPTLWKIIVLRDKRYLLLTLRSLRKIVFMQLYLLKKIRTKLVVTDVRLFI